MIVDASVLAKTFVEEEDSDDVRALILLLTAREKLLSPELVKYELGSVALKVSRGGRTPPFAEAIGLVDEVPFDPILLTRSIEVARSNGLSFYDGCYLALAEMEDCLLWTADGALLEKAPKSTVSTGTLLEAFAETGSE
ncbi:MAG: type II toxin-antitoxin system VapC family toxin [Candidatus Thermoplasmatota archaeon]|nr:type II toxin-antitoxin system VapC family toxin [Candidatus Thermoplasmatota archaeon]